MSEPNYGQMAVDALEQNSPVGHLLLFKAKKPYKVIARHAYALGYKAAREAAVDLIPAVKRHGPCKPPRKLCGWCSIAKKILAMEVPHD